MIIFNKISIYILSIVAMLFVSLTGCSNATSVDSGNEDDNPKKSIPAFPGAEGFAAKTTTGGRGGKVIYVTNLKDSGPGSLRAAVNTIGARYILFKVSGTIKLKSNLEIGNPNVTIAGQTAPGGGITIRNYSTIVSANNVIIRFLRFRMGDTAGHIGDALGGRFHKNIIIDHCSVSWSTDEGLSFYQNTNTTVQWCITSEALNNSVHNGEKHGYGGIFGGKRASFHHNLIAHNASRNPRFGEYRGSTFALTDLVDYRNNVIYNWGGNSAYGGEAMNINIVNNYYKPGPATDEGVSHRIMSIDKRVNPDAKLYGTWGKFYIHGNYVVGSTKTTKNNWKYGVFNQFASKYGEVPQEAKEAMRMTNPFPIHGNVTTQTPKEAYESVLKYAGASLYRDSVDKRIIDEVRTGTYTYEGSKGSTGGIIDSQADVGGWPTLPEGEAPKDTDGDGIPDNWEQKKGLNPTNPNTNGHELHDVYTNLEVYLHSLVEEITKNQYK